MAAVTFLGYTIIKSQAEREIQMLFEGYQKTLLEQKQKLCDDITGWGDALIQSICKHANLQKCYLDQEYSRQVRELNESRNQFIEDLHVREQMKNTEEINQLLEQCRALKYQLAALEISEQTIPYIEVPCKKKLVKNNRNGFDDADIGMFSIDNDSIENDHKGVQNNVITNPTLYRNPSLERTKQTETHSLPINPVHDGNRWINDNGNPEFSDAKENGYAKKCPVCFMIFPLTMALPDRSQHVQEHYVNE